MGRRSRGGNVLAYVVDEKLFFHISRHHLSSPSSTSAPAPTRAPSISSRATSTRPISLPLPTPVRAPPALPSTPTIMPRSMRTSQPPLATSRVQRRPPMPPPLAALRPVIRARCAMDWYSAYAMLKFVRGVSRITARRAAEMSRVSGKVGRVESKVSFESGGASGMIVGTRFVAACALSKPT